MNHDATGTRPLDPRALTDIKLGLVKDPRHGIIALTQEPDFKTDPKASLKIFIKEEEDRQKQIDAAQERNRQSRQLALKHAGFVHPLTDEPIIK